MADFNIVIRVNPSNANTGIGQVQSGLRSTGAQADALRIKIAQAFQFNQFSSFQATSTQVIQNITSIRQGLDRTAASADLLSNNLRRVFSVFTAAAAVHQLVELADAFTTVQNRVSLVVRGQDELAIVTQELFNTSNLTRTGFEETAQIYSRVALSARQLGASQQELLDFTESLNKAIILSGATTRESRNAMIQLAQGIASATLRGDELRSVLEQLPYVADIIAKKMGVTRGELRKLGSEGKISAKTIFDAFREFTDEINDKFAKTVPTIGQSLTVLRNKAIELLAEFNRTSGVVGVVSQVVLGLGNNLETVLRIIGGLIIAMGTRGLIGAFIALAAAIAANPIGLFVSLIGSAIGLFLSFSDRVHISATSVATVFDVIVVAFNRVVDVVSSGVELVLQAFGFVSDAAGGIDFTSIALGAARAVDTVVGLFYGARDAILQIWADLPNLLGEAAITGLNLALDAVTVGISAVADVVVEVVSTVRDVASAVADFFTELPGVVFDFVVSTVTAAAELVYAFVQDIPRLIANIPVYFDRVVEAVKYVWRELPRALASILIDGLNKLLSGVESFVNGVIYVLNRIPGIAIDVVSGIAPQIENPFKGAGEGVGRAAAEGFEKGLRDGIATGAVSDIIQSAEQRARERIVANRALAERIAAARAGLGDKPPGGGRTPPTPPTKAELAYNKALKDRENIVRRDIEVLENEAAILEVVGDDRDVLRNKLQLEEKLRTTLRQSGRKLTEQQINDLAHLTDAEAEAAEAAVRHNLEMKRESALLETLQGPTRTYANNMEALNSLLGKGKIGLQEYRDEALRLQEELENQQFSRLPRMLQEIQGPQHALAQGQRELNQLFADGRITLEQYTNNMLKLRIAALEASTNIKDGFARGLLKVQQEFTNLAELSERVVTNAFKGMEDALVNFVRTGKLEFSDLINSIAADITRLALRQTITGPLAELLGSTAGGGGLLGSLFGGSGADGGDGFFSGIFDKIGGLLGFASGGSFEVGGNSGTDQNVLSVNGSPVARVSRGERVVVEPESNGGPDGRRPVNVVMNISTPDANSFKRSQGQIVARVAAQISRANARDR